MGMANGRPGKTFHSSCEGCGGYSKPFGCDRCSLTQYGCLLQNWTSHFRSAAAETNPHTNRVRVQVQQQHTHDISADKPVSQPPEDRLGYDALARHIAASILAMTAPEGFVIAVHGRWGSGKTSLLNLIEYHLQGFDGSDIKNAPAIVRFNPWWFSSREDLAQLLFSQFLAKLSGRALEVNRLRTKLANFAEAVSDAPIPYASGAKGIATLARPKAKDVPALKEETGELLRKHGTRFLVVIDDIDRLTPPEIVQLFRVVKAVGDLPNVIYLLAFDQEIANNAFKDVYGPQALDYLEKIVQLPLELPLFEKRALRSVLFEKLDLIVGESPPELFDTDYWANVFFEGIDPFLQTPRDIVRLSNALAMTYGAVKGEVNVVDFLAIEALRLFCPSVYETIRANQEAFALFADGIAQYGAPTSAHAELYTSILKELGPQEASIKKLLARLFPRLNRHWNNMLGSGDGPTLRRHLRICIPEHFPTYFRLARPEGSLSYSRMKAMLERANDSAAFGAELVGLTREIGPDGTSSVRQFLEWLQDYTRDEIALAEVPHIIRALLDVGDKLLRDGDRTLSLFDFGNEVRIGRVIHQLTLRLNETERFTILSNAIYRGRALATISSETATWGQEHGKYRSQANPPAIQCTLTADQLRQIERIVVDKIKQSADDESLISCPRLPQILYLWHELAGDQEVKLWAKRAIGDIEWLVRFVAGFAQYTVSHTAGHVSAKRELRLDPDELSIYLESNDLETAVVRLRKWMELERVQDRYLPAIEQFLREWDARWQDQPLSEQ